jgi:hypothetical protein
MVLLHLEFNENWKRSILKLFIFIIEFSVIVTYVNPVEILYKLTKRKDKL